jgi:hypothetical protein
VAQENSHNLEKAVKVVRRVVSARRPLIREARNGICIREIHIKVKNMSDLPMDAKGNLSKWSTYKNSGHSMTM